LYSFTLLLAKTRGLSRNNILPALSTSFVYIVTMNVWKKPLALMSRCQMVTPLL